MKLEEVKFDCVFFRGHIPCSPNKEHGVACSNCDFYQAIETRILIIKLGAIGDVIRTTPLIESYRKTHPNCHITWLTLFPDVLPKESIEDVLKWEVTSLYKIQNRKFDIAINLDKDEEACQLLAHVDAKEKYGFIWENNHISAATEAATHKLITGFFDHISIRNTKNYLEEIFEVCHLKFEGQEYQIRKNETLIEKWNSHIKSIANGKKVIGLNTGCGPRWKTRLWSKENWISLIKDLESQGYFCMILGGAAEDEVNQYYAKQTGAYYPGHFSLEEFITLTNTCDLIVTQVSLMMHIAIALQKKMVLMNNIFNAHEFELYGRGEIIQPTTGCDCYYGNTCSREVSCMKDISVSMILESVNKFS